ncbi:hypothetical protein F4804DRAFT_330403 [Jackrogersella minutella]|nr:hypothetical protein F4804DRAFT_330403 [Jackrogersella minutella]
MPIELPLGMDATPQTDWQQLPPFYPLPGLTPRILHEPQICPCDQCVFMRLSRRMGATPSLEPSASENDEVKNTHHERPKPRASKNNGTRRPDTESQKRTQQAGGSPLAVSTLPHPEIAYPEVYIYPGTSHHLTFPVVNYSAKQRAQTSSPWPVCYMAISPQCAKPADFEAVLSPLGSGLITVARLSTTKKTAPLAEFRDAEELRGLSIQLEVWDEDAAKTPAKDGDGVDVVHESNKAGASTLKKKKKKVTKENWPLP